MIRAVLVRNRRSARNRAGAGAAAAPPDVSLIDCDSFGGLTGDLRQAHSDGVEIILIDGGDGTVREVLSRLPEIWGAALPRIGILPRGNTNLIAREVGGLDRPGAVAALLHRIAAGPAPTTRRRALLRADFPAGDRPPLRGFILGWGAYAAGTRLARDEISARGAGQVAMAAAATLRRALFGAERRTLRKGVAASLVIDGAPMASNRRFLGLATTLQGPLIAGINPFWGDPSGPIRWLDIQAPGRRLALAAPFLARGKPRRWMTRAGYASGSAARIELTLDSPFVMDGEFFAPPAGGRMILSADEEIDFVSL